MEIFTKTYIENLMASWIGKISGSWQVRSLYNELEMHDNAHRASPFKIDEYD